MPEEAQGGEHTVDCMQTTDKELDGLSRGSWETSGTESQMMVRLVLLGEDLDCTAIQTLDERANDSALRGVGMLVGGVEGRDAKTDLPE